MKGVLLSLLGLFVLSFAEPQEDLITEQLPKFNGKLNFKQYAGYLNISTKKKLFYWYVESQSDPDNDPVALWLNGGPGCSSLQGMMLELGPFRVTDWGNSVTTNPWSWNKYSNVIFLDAPAGVGFSVRTDGLSNYTDDEVAVDNRLALLKWFEKFPERKKNDFYIMGESYAGTYIPMLASLLVKDSANFVNFKGMAVGNGCVNDKLLFNSAIQYTYYHALIDETLYMNAVKKCCQDTSATECDFYTRSSNKTDPCYNDILDLYMARYESGLDPYFLYFTCYLNAPAKTKLSSVQSVMQRHMHRKFLAHMGKEEEKEIHNRDDDPENPAYDPNLPQCAHHNDYSIWLQLPELRKVIHVPDDVPPYSGCSQTIEDNYVSQYPDMSRFVKEVIDAKKKVLFYNGDMDSVCNVIHNEQFMARLGLKRTMSKVAWKDVMQKPAAVGYWTQYEGLDFLTVRGAGHFTPATDEKPKESLQMYYNFLKGNNYTWPLPEYTVMDASTSIPIQTTTNSSFTSMSLLSLLLALIVMFL